MMNLKGLSCDAKIEGGPYKVKRLVAGQTKQQQRLSNQKAVGCAKTAVSNGRQAQDVVVFAAAVAGVQGALGHGVVRGLVDGLVAIGGSLRGMTSGGGLDWSLQDFMHRGEFTRCFVAERKQARVRVIEQRQILDVVQAHGASGGFQRGHGVQQRETACAHATRCAFEGCS